MVVFYKGSFDPPHTGHLMNAMLAKAYTSETVLIVPNHASPTKKLSPLQHRLKMLNLMFENVTNVRIADAYKGFSDEEIKSRPLKELLTTAYNKAFTQPKAITNFKQLLGMDAMLRNIKRGDKEIDDPDIQYVLTSRGVQADDAFVRQYFDNVPGRVQYIPFSQTLNHSSSSEIRKAVHDKSGMQVLSSLNKNVYRYIIHHNLYRG